MEFYHKKNKDKANSIRTLIKSMFCLKLILTPWILTLVKHVVDQKKYSIVK